MCRDGSPQQDHQPLPHVWDEPVTPLPTATGASRRSVLTAAGAAAVVEGFRLLDVD